MAALHAGSLLAAGLLQPLSENSRPGHQLSTVALYPGIGFVNSNTATGLRVCLYDDRIGSRDTGKERDSESGPDYFGARYYGSALGRFTSPDDGSDQHPENPQSWNLYSYVRNNPLSDIDPDGHACTHSTGPNGESIVEDADGTGCAELRSNSVTVGAYDNAGIAMLAGLGDRFSGPNMAQFVSDAGRATASLIALPCGRGH